MEKKQAKKLVIQLSCQALEERIAPAAVGRSCEGDEILHHHHHHHHR